MHYHGTDHLLIVISEWNLVTALHWFVLINMIFSNRIYTVQINRSQKY